MNLVFYNHYGNGDLFESREFVLDWMRLSGVKTAKYAHRRLPGIFADLPQIESIDVMPEMDMRRAVTRVEGRARVSTLDSGQSTLDPELWVNTWIGARNAETNPTGDYVLWPGVGCTVENLYRMHNDYLREAGLLPLPRSVVRYIPSIDYSRIDCGRVDEFCNEHARYDRKIALICNGPTGSGHASNFNYAEMLERIEPRHDRIFVLTEGKSGVTPDRPEARDDIFFTDYITGRNPGGWDLNAISYLSRFCDVIVGRCSGAQMFTQVLPNWMDSTKTQVCFTQHRNGACFVRDPEALGLNMKVAWSPAEDAETAAEFLKQYL
jgi:hypothetical protein